MFVLDTNVVSELRKAGDDRADPNMTAWIAGRDAAAFFLSAITVMELEIGVRRIERAPEQADSLQAPCPPVQPAQSRGRRKSLYSRASGVPASGFQS